MTNLCDFSRFLVVPKTLYFLARVVYGRRAGQGARWIRKRCFLVSEVSFELAAPSGRDGVVLGKGPLAVVVVLASPCCMRPDRPTEEKKKKGK